MDPATAAGLALAVVPLMLFALENYEYTFQPIIIFTRHYRREVERFQIALKVQKVVFQNECCLLLDRVQLSQGDVMIDDLTHPLWRDSNLEDRIRLQLDESYDACISSLFLINQILAEILKETGTLEILAQQKHSIPNTDWKDWLKRFRQRSKISFSKDRFDGKLEELQNRIDGLTKLRKQVERFKADRQMVKVTHTAAEDLAHFRLVQGASLKLYDVLSNLWHCDLSNQHSANLSLGVKGVRACEDGSTQNVQFESGWSCLASNLPMSQQERSLWLSIEARSKGPTVTENAARRLHQSLTAALERSKKPQASLHSQAQSCSATNTLLPDLEKIPNLCSHLLGQSPHPDPPTCAGFLQKGKTDEHLLYADGDRTIKRDGLKSLEDALNAAKTDPEGIPYPEKLTLAKLLALAVLRFHSTPWLNSEWGSRDIVFYGITDFSEDSLNGPFLKSMVASTAGSTNQIIVAPNVASQTTMSRQHSPICNQTLYNLGVMLVELAYNRPLQDLQKPEDDQGDPYTSYWTATRMGDKVGRKLGPVYADAVNICLYGGFGPSSDLKDTQVQARFFDEVIRKLAKCAEAVMI